MLYDGTTKRQNTEPHMNNNIERMRTHILAKSFFLCFEFFIADAFKSNYLMKYHRSSPLYSSQQRLRYTLKKIGP